MAAVVWNSRTRRITCAHATARDKSWAGGESIAGAGLVVEVVATLVALFERERGEGGKVKRRRRQKETRRERGRRGVSKCCLASEV